MDQLARFLHWLVDEPLPVRGKASGREPRFRSKQTANAVLTTTSELRAERNNLKAALQRSLGHQADQLSNASLITRINEPSGPGARGLLDTFATVEVTLADAVAADPAVLASDRHLENLLRKRAATLHIGPANLCWFSDPTKALCLRLAGTPDATPPLVGTCDSARCPQATHHQCHRLVWADQATQTQVLLGNPRVSKAEKTRLAPELDRALRVLAEIDAAARPEDRDVPTE